MTKHKFRVGQKVMFDAPRRTTGASVYTVLRQLPRESNGLTYRIKSREGSEERVASEIELVALT